MRSPIALVIAASLLGMAQSAGAANPPSSPVKPTASATAQAPAAKPAAAPAHEDPKHAACEKTWQAQTKHTGKHKAFIAACVAKG